MSKVHPNFTSLSSQSSVYHVGVCLLKSSTHSSKEGCVQTARYYIYSYTARIRQHMGYSYTCYTFYQKLHEIKYTVIQYP